MLKEIRNLGLLLCVALAACFLVYKFVFQIDPVAKPTLVTESIVNSPLIDNLDALHSYSYGPIDAKVTVVEFFDPECESCSAVAPYLKKEMKFYEGKVRWVFRYMAYHNNSRNAIKVLEAARKQNLFLEVQHILFESQKEWGEQKISTEDKILKIVEKVKPLNMKQLKKDMNDQLVADIISTDKDDGQQAGVTGTPTFFVNGIILKELDIDLLLRMINERL